MDMNVIRGKRKTGEEAIDCDTRTVGVYVANVQRDRVMWEV